MYDKDKTGTIDVNEFQQLFESINQWKGVFEGYDSDRSGRIEQNELIQGEINIHLYWATSIVSSPRL